jgi:transcriptional antiterminator NusG
MAEIGTRHWYVVRTHSNCEREVAAAIRERAQRRGLAHLFDETVGAGGVLVPTEKVVELRGQKIAAERKFCPGYVIIRADLNWYVDRLIRAVPKVIGFLDAGDGAAAPLSDAEAARLLHQVRAEIEAKPRVDPSTHFDPGETIRVSDGPFASFNGTIEEVDDVRQRAKVLVDIFGRPSPIELEFSQIEKL